MYQTNKPRYWIAVASKNHVMRGVADGFAQVRLRHLSVCSRAMVLFITHLKWSLKGMFPANRLQLWVM